MAVPLLLPRLDESFRGRGEALRRPACSSSPCTLAKRRPHAAAADRSLRGHRQCAAWPRAKPHVKLSRFDQAELSLSPLSVKLVSSLAQSLGSPVSKKQGCRSFATEVAEGGLAYAKPPKTPPRRALSCGAVGPSSQEDSVLQKLGFGSEAARWDCSRKLQHTDRKLVPKSVAGDSEDSQKLSVPVQIAMSYPRRPRFRPAPLSLNQSAPQQRLRSCLRRGRSPPQSAPVQCRRVSWDSHVVCVAVTPSVHKDSPLKFFDGEHSFGFEEVPDADTEVDVLQSALVGEGLLLVGGSEHDDDEDSCADNAGFGDESEGEDALLNEFGQGAKLLHNDTGLEDELGDDLGWSPQKSLGLVGSCGDLGGTWRRPRRQQSFPRDFAGAP